MHFMVIWCILYFDFQFHGYTIFRPKNESLNSWQVLHLIWKTRYKGHLAEESMLIGGYSI